MEEKRTFDSELAKEAPPSDTKPEVKEEVKPVEEKESKPEEKNNNKTLSIVLIIIVLVLLALCSVIAYQYVVAPSPAGEATEEVEDDQGEDEDLDAEAVEDDQGEDEDMDEDGENEEEASDTTYWEGDYLSADLPTGWTIVEYLNGVNDGLLQSGGTVYTGLTGFAILDDTSTMVFESNGAWGIGGLDYCEYYYQFPDYNVAHYNEKVTNNTDMGEAAPIMEDFTATVYTEYEVLGTPWRRIDAQFYWDEDQTNATFEAACSGLSMASPPFENLNFDASGDTVETYMSEIMLSASDTAKLELLDGVLESLAVL